jgi:hypothetical protein
MPRRLRHSVGRAADDPSVIELELRARLANILALAQSIAERRVAPRHFREYARLCRSEATRLTRLVEDAIAIVEATRANGTTLRSDRDAPRVVGAPETDVVDNLRDS